MKVYNNILETIGDTPIVKLNRMAPKDGPNIYVKLEYLNPAGSIKDRIAMHIINKAEQEGKLKKDGTIVENTSGNTGAGLAMVAAVKGYKSVFTIPDKMSAEKINFIKSFGSRVVVTPTNVPAESPQSYYETAKRIAKNTSGSFYVNQYHNPDNPEAHYTYTGPEIWEQMDGKIDYLVAGIGTGGTLSGIAKFLKEKNPEIKVIAVDPIGSVFYDYFKHGKPGEPHVYKLEGIGEDMMVDAMDFNVVDDIIQVGDKDGFMTCREMARLEGIFAGGSSGAAVWAALQFAKDVPAGKNILTILPDTGFRYLSKFYNDEWMRDNGMTDSGETALLSDVLDQMPKRSLISTHSNALVRDVIHQMKSHNISQMPVFDDGNLIGLITEGRLLEYLAGSDASSSSPIAQLVETHLNVFEANAPLTDVLTKIRESSNVALVHKPDGTYEIMTKIDIIEFLSK